VDVDVSGDMPQKLRKGCDGTRDRAQKSAARRKRPREKIFSLQDGGGIGGNLCANSPRSSQRPCNTPKDFFALTAVKPQNFCSHLSSSDFASVLWFLGKAKKED
jgi:hypothetical protein